MKRIKRQVRFGCVWVYRKARPLLQYLALRYAQVREYYRTHPKARKWTIAGLVIGGPPLLLLLVVWIEVPGKRALRNIQNQVASEIYSADSVLLGRYYLQDRTEIRFDDIAPVVVDALIATEDVRFYEHGGVDYESLGRVFVKSILLQEESAGGGSTLSQQLSKNLYPRKRYWVLSMLINKMRESITAQRLEDLYPKKELIRLYLNTIPFGDQCFGIEAAAKRFFSVRAKDLTADQAAVLIGMLKATHNYNPRLFPERSRTRRNVVLAQMQKYKRFPEGTLDSLQALPLELKYNMVSHHQGLAPYFREYLKGELLEWCRNNTRPDGSPYNLYTDGLKIYTTLDSRLQEYAENAVARQMKEVQKQFADHWRKENPWQGHEEVIQDAIRRCSRYKALAEKGLSEEEILDEMQKPMPMRMFSWDGEKVVKMSPIDSIKHHIQFLNAGFLAIEPKTGRVRAWVGGIEHDFFQYDHVKVSTKRQVGSIFKPIVYATAIERGAQPCDLISAAQETYIDKEGDKWTPRNMQNDYQVKYTMRGALAYSINTVAVKMIQQAGVLNTMETARNMGITSELPDVPSIALGSSSISLMEMVTAYSCFVNTGMAVHPYYITGVRDRSGNTYTEFKPAEKSKRVLKPETAELIVGLLRTVVHEGTASRLRWKYAAHNNDVAGKTGTTQANADGWFMGMTPELVMGTWVGADDPRIHFRSTELGQGGNTALPMVGYFLQQINEDPNFKTISKATFPTPSRAAQQKLSCDLYELDETLWGQLEQMSFKQDSLRAADTLNQVPKESYMEKLYKRKLKMRQASQARDSAALRTLEIEDSGG
ncbi:transglycosylase domain-containing protein [Parachryseolinea silvisoli]|uniref:transglycosylase domain-containing protein n=1 Tax=Parachryseolinea silvisoli TaxID=2873601 RepID=UPI002265F9DA|nr:transglycosylase domain-containing protein [Parachryseolinea silvisoli]MCD9018994.1 transglycosylase domain-containing protein [Parachryseolinea silvisoli]